MRSLLSRSRPALVAAAAAVLLTSCSGGGSASEEAAESTSADTSTSAAPEEDTSGASGGSGGSEDPAVAAFCAQSSEFSELGNRLAAATPDQLPGLLQETAGAFDSVQPPAEIASAWQAVGDAVQSFADQAGTIDATTPEGQAQLQTAAQEFVAVANGPDGTAVQQFGQANCGTGGTPAPTT